MSEEYPWDRFKGTRNEWAWFTIKNYDLPSAKDYDLVEDEIKYKELLQTREECESLQAKFRATEDHLDLMVDEFSRIKALTKDAEIIGLCERAVSNTKQRVSVIEQRDGLKAKLKDYERLIEAQSKTIDAIFVLTENDSIMRRCKYSMQLYTQIMGRKDGEK